MSSHHIWACTGGDTEQPSLPSTDLPPPPEDAERNGGGDHHVKEPPRNDRQESSAGCGANKVNQEAVTAAVLDTLSNPKVIRRMLAVISPEGPTGSASSKTASETDVELIWQRPNILQYGHEPSSHLYETVSLVFLLAAGASPLGDMPDVAELASLQLYSCHSLREVRISSPLSPAIGGDLWKVVSAGATHSIPGTDCLGDFSNSASTS